MIELNIVSCFDLGDSMQSLDVYGQKRLVSFFYFSQFQKRNRILLYYSRILFLLPNLHVKRYPNQHAMIYLIICISLGKFYLKLPIHIFNVINVLLMDYLIGPIV